MVGEVIEQPIYMKGGEVRKIVESCMMGVVDMYTDFIVHGVVNYQR